MANGLEAWRAIRVAGFVLPNNCGVDGHALTVGCVGGTGRHLALVPKLANEVVRRIGGVCASLAASDYKGLSRSADAGRERFLADAVEAGGAVCSIGGRKGGVADGVDANGFDCARADIGCLPLADKVGRTCAALVVPERLAIRVYVDGKTVAVGVGRLLWRKVGEHDLHLSKRV